MQVAQAADLQDIQKQKEQNQAEVDLDPVSSLAAFTLCTDKSCLVSELHLHPLLNRATGIQGWKQSGEVRGGAGGMLHCSKQLLSSAAGHEEPRSEQRGLSEETFWDGKGTQPHAWGMKWLSKL